MDGKVTLRKEGAERRPKEDRGKKKEGLSGFAVYRWRGKGKK